MLQSERVQALTLKYPGRHISGLQVLQWFDYNHLPMGLARRISEQMSQVAASMFEGLPDGPELTTGLRKLLEAKDCLVRSALP